MKNSTIIGIILAIIGIFGGMVVKGAPISSLLNPAAYMIIILGTVAAVMIAFPMSELQKPASCLKWYLAHRT